MLLLPMYFGFGRVEFLVQEGVIVLEISVGWMDGWMDGWVDGWVGGWVDGWMGGWMDGWMDG